jgi:hypothetical protein
MGHVSDPDFLVLHGLRLKGFAEVSILAELTGMTGPEVTQRLEEAAGSELALRRDGRISGWTLTPTGRARHAALLDEDLAAAGCRDALRAVYPRFEEFNGELKALCTDWQLRAGIPNDHADSRYDAAVISRLGTLNEGMMPVCAELAAHLNRMAPYGPRLTGAVQRVAAGDRNGFTRPLANSYHDIWMELHEDLISSLGLARTAADA